MRVYKSYPSRVNLWYAKVYLQVNGGIFVGNELLIGDKLRQARLNKNISIDELQQKTKIQKRYLEAIEQGKFDLLPGEYYIRTFLQSVRMAIFWSQFLMRKPFLMKNIAFQNEKFQKHFRNQGRDMRQKHELG